MNKIAKYLEETKVFFLATTDGDQPKIRPLGAFIEADGKVIFGVGTFKNVYKQLVKNPLTEIVACKEDGHWMRYTGRAVFETDEKYEKQMLEEAPHLKEIYNEKTGNKLGMFHLEDAAAVDIPIMGEGTSLL